ncbi:MAG TPA: hypothetical protein VNI82_00120 [Candidatus Nitrosotenuis sp.]|nr:hypothetical protein [Candidatus Nitrosotenuis sp.]
MKIPQQGFTIVELIVIITVSAVFFLSAIQLSLSISSMAADGSQRTVASNVAYKNLRKYANGAKPSWYDCVTYGNGPYTLLTSTDPIDGLPSPVTQTIVASAPYGCGNGATSGMPIRVQAQIIYGPSQRTITHATYATY